MSKPTVAFSCRVAPEVQEALRRATALTGWSQAQLIESLVLNLQGRWLERFSADERQRYESCAIDRAEFVELCRRAKRAAGSGAASDHLAMADAVPLSPKPAETSGRAGFGDFGAAA